MVTIPRYISKGRSPMTYAKLFSSIVHSTVWREKMHVKVVWITMLALANRHGEVSASIPGLADAAKVSLDQCHDALNRLSAPDVYSRTKEYEGRRITEHDGGWLILTYVKHRDTIDKEEGREKTRARVAKHRAAKKVTERADSNAPKQDVRPVASGTPSDQLNSTQLNSTPETTSTDSAPSALALSFTTPPIGEENAKEFENLAALAKPLPKQKKVNYVIRACEVWTELKGGTVKPGRMGSALKPLMASVRKRHPELASDAEAWEKMEPYFRSYLETTDDGYCSPEAFAKAPRSGTGQVSAKARARTEGMRAEIEGGLRGR